MIKRIDAVSAFVTKQFSEPQSGKSFAMTLRQFQLFNGFPTNQRQNNASTPPPTRSMK
jgi:hypothetical protein